MDLLFRAGFLGGALALLFALSRLRRILPLSPGGAAAQGLTAALRKGTHAYLKWQLLLSGAGLALAFALAEALVYFRLLDRLAPLALLSGGVCALLTGLLGAELTAVAGPRAAQAAGERLDRGTDVALNTGAAISFLAVGLGLLHVSAWLALLKGHMDYGPEAAARTMLFFGVGSALVSLFFQMGSFFARSAGLAAEIVDREMGLPPDSPQNPAIIAQQIGYGVGPVCGMAAGGYTSYESVLLTALFTGCAAYLQEDMAWNAMLLPLALAGAGAFTAWIGTMTIRPREHSDRYSLPWCLRLASALSAVLTAAVCLPLSYFLMGSWGPCLPVFAGLAAGMLTCLTGEYFTSDAYKPARSLAETAETGTVSAVTRGMSWGLCSSVFPALLAVCALTLAFYTSGGMDSFARGLYGMSLAAVGLLSTSAVTLTGPLCGPVGDCAANVSSLIDADEVARRRSDHLSAIVSCAANGGACLSALATGFSGLMLLFCLSRIFETAQAGLDLAQMGPPLLLGILLGGVVTFLFLGLSLLSLWRPARAILLQARFQFQDNEALLEETESPDYAACVSVGATRSLLYSLLPILTALLSPVGVGLLLGLSGLIGFLGCILILSVTLSLFFSLTGGILSGARRYVESGRRGGRGSPCHRFTLQAERTLSPLSQVAAPALLSLARAAIAVALLCGLLVSFYNLPTLLGQELRFAAVLSGRLCL